MWTVLFCALLGAIANRFSGWTNQSWVPGRHIYWAALALFLISWELLGLGWAAAVAASVLLYRIPGWDHSLDMGTVGDTVHRDATVMFIRTLYLAPMFLYGTLIHGVWIAPVLWVAAAAGAVAIYYLGNHYGPKFTKDPFRFIEPGVGAVIGAMFGVMAALS
jgi:hypothetical protein